MITVDLQDGFNGESVQILIDGKEVWQKNGVQTKKLVGHAEHLNFFDIPESVTVQVVVNQKFQDQRQINQTAKHVGVTLDGNRLHWVISSRPFGYC